MGYTNRYGKRPFEYASKSAHGYVIKDVSVQEFLQNCELPKAATSVSIPSSSCVQLANSGMNPIKHIIAVDGGFNEVAVRTEFSSLTNCFFPFWAFVFFIYLLQKPALPP